MRDRQPPAARARRIPEWIGNGVRARYRSGWADTETARSRRVPTTRSRSLALQAPSLHARLTCRSLVLAHCVPVPTVRVPHLSLVRPQWEGQLGSDLGFPSAWARLGGWSCVDCGLLRSWSRACSAAIVPPVAPETSVPTQRVPACPTLSPLPAVAIFKLRHDRLSLTRDDLVTIFSQ